MTSNHKRDEFTTKKKDDKTKSFEVQKSTKGKGLACQDQDIEESLVKKARMGSPRAAKGSGSMGRITQLRKDGDNLERVPRNTRNEEHIYPSPAPSGAAKNQKAWRVIIHEQKSGTLGNPE